MSQYLIGIRDPAGSIIYRTYAWNKKQKNKIVNSILDSFYTGERLTEFSKMIRSEIIRGKPYSIVVKWTFSGKTNEERFPILV